MKSAPLQSRRLGPGDKLGTYDLIRQIAIGGMAELYLARTLGIEGFEKLSVIKRILPEFAANASFVDRFLGEARLAATLHHPNIAQVYDVGVEAGDYFFAMEYVHGEDLARMTAQSADQGVPISLDAVLTLVAGLCAGLHHAHEKAGPDGQPLHVVHRDVSPSNVLVSYDGAVKLVDFGIARGARGKPTARGRLEGKIAYMSPEQCRADAAIDRRSDIYAVGTMLYELSTGRRPFAGETDAAVLDQILHREAPPPSAIVPDYPPALERIVLRALARDSRRRYTTAVELQGELEDFAHEHRLRVSPLVLARLMGALFPTRLEEWDHAKSQGAFFVEQHVVRTLIESGKTPDPNDPAVEAHARAMARQLELVDPTVLHQALPADDATATTRVTPRPTPAAPPRISPRTSRGSAPALPPPPSVASPPRPGSRAGHGEDRESADVLGLVDDDAVVTTPASPLDGTARMPAPPVSPAEITAPVARRERGPILVLALGGVVAAGLAGLALFVASGAPSPAAPDRPPASAPSPVAAPEAAAPPARIAPTATRPGAGIEADAPARARPVGRAGSASAPTPGARPVAVRKPLPPPGPAHPRARPVVKPEPEDKPAWNADSPFMPIRTAPR